MAQHLKRKMEARINQEEDPEITAIGIVFNALKDLDAAAQDRVLSFVTRKLGLRTESKAAKGEHDSPTTPATRQEPDKSSNEEREQQPEDSQLDGVSSIAVKWMKRCGFTADQLSRIFSLGGDEIDLISKKVPGSSIRARLRSVLLLKGIAAYLASGAARFTYDQIKETSIHYRAYDKVNFGRDLKEFGAELSGTRESGFTLTSRGFANAAELITTMVRTGEETK